MPSWGLELTEVTKLSGLSPPCVGWGCSCQRCPRTEVHMLQVSILPSNAGPAPGTSAAPLGMACAGGEGDSPFPGDSKVVPSLQVAADESYSRVPCLGQCLCPCNVHEGLSRP